MNKRPTPETDSKASPHIGFYSCATVPAEFARQIERERDEWAAMCGRYKQERDEALNEIKRLRLDAQREAEQHDRMVKELEGLYDKLKS